MNVERRKFMRHRVPESTLFMFDHDTNQMAVIKDISMNGLKFQYLMTANNKIKWEMIDIFNSGPNRLHLLEVHCCIIYIQNSLDQNQSFTGSHVRMGGLKFDRITAAQQKKLESAIAIIEST